MSYKRPCPKCGSGNYYVISNIVNRDSWYECDKCGYTTKGKGVKYVKTVKKVFTRKTS